MSYADSIKPYHQNNNGRGTFIALIAQYAREDKWQKLLKDKSEIHNNRHWSGQVKFTLEKFILANRNLYVMVTQCVDNVDHQILNELTHVNLLLNAIECKDTGLNAAISMLKGDKGPTGKMNKFKYYAAYLTPWDPIANNCNTNRKFGAA